MRTRRAAFAMLLSATIAGAGSVPELIPIDRDFTLFKPYPAMYAYDLAVRDALLGEPAREGWEAIVIPSFEREWAVHLEERDGEHRVVLTVMQQQLWGRLQEAASRPDGSIQPGDEVAALRGLSRDTWRHSASLSRTTAVLLGNTWSAMLAYAKPPPEPRRCIDGTSYFIFQREPSMGGRGGMGRCGPSDGPTAALLEILEDLRRAAGASGQELMRLDMSLAKKAAVLSRTLVEEPSRGLR